MFSGVMLYVLIAITCILSAVVIYYVYRKIGDSEEYNNGLVPTPALPSDDMLSGDKMLNVSDMDSNLDFFNFSAYDKIPTDPEPNIRGVTVSELSPIDGRVMFKNIIPEIDRLR